MSDIFTVVFYFLFILFALDCLRPAKSGAHATPRGCFQPSTSSDSPVLCLRAWRSAAHSFSAVRSPSSPSSACTSSSSGSTALYFSSRCRTTDRGLAGLDGWRQLAGRRRGRMFSIPRESTLVSNRHAPPLPRPSGGGKVGVGRRLASLCD